MPTARFMHKAVADSNGKIWIIGGSSGYGSTTNSVLKYDPLTNTYSSSGNSPFSLNFIGATMAVDNNIYVNGGNSDYSFFQVPQLILCINLILPLRLGQIYRQTLPLPMLYFNTH